MFSARVVAFVKRFEGFAGLKRKFFTSFGAGSLEFESAVPLSSLSHLRNGLLGSAKGFELLPFSDVDELPFC